MYWGYGLLKSMSQAGRFCRELEKVDVGDWFAFAYV